ncbi:CLUMA_CG017961, isoform A [Clunio marinus]|uniref:CLUMA_CG017961, isoform A n=1 Tax=Clunio marinus TaxID=568069 RepID=A0A1J1J3I1_9DIPT|nr:CLUMA_CG017961, isoform A [Clunio marinus]
MNETIVKINSSFVSERINKVRFVETESSQEPDMFLSGSSDNKNNVKLWKLIRNEFSDEMESELVPKAFTKISVDGEVTGLEVVDHNNFVVSSGSGISFVWINRDIERNNLRENKRFKNLHKFKTGDSALCTGVALYDDSVCSIGEDGKIAVLSLTSQKLSAEIEKADSVTQTAVKFISYKELITGNRLGIMKSFDLRSGLKEATATFAISCEDEKKSNGVTCIAYHPTQQHIILGGSEEGSITVYDLRQPSYPASYLSAHDHAITELMFHPTQPDKLFSTSTNGEMWKWTQNMIQTIPQDFEAKTPLETVNSWLNGERAKKNVQISTVLSGLRKSITSVDCSKQSRLVCSCNNEAIYLIDNVY